MASNYFYLLSYSLLALIVVLTTALDKQYLFVTLTMVLMPLFDKMWKPPVVRFNGRLLSQWLLMGIIVVALLYYRPQQIEFFILTLLFAAIPEEWFFRAYFMTRAGQGLKANLLASLAFVLLHAITRDIQMALLVFVPSLVFGWLYQKQKDLITVIILHAFSNLVYVIYLRQFIQAG